MKNKSYKRVILGAIILSGTLIAGVTVAVAQEGGVQLSTATTESFAPCDQEMTTCPCNGVRVNKDVVKTGDILMLRLDGTSVVSFPLRIE